MPNRITDKPLTRRGFFSISMPGIVEYLNFGATSGIVLYEIVKQRAFTTLYIDKAETHLVLMILGGYHHLNPQSSHTR